MTFTIKLDDAIFYPKVHILSVALVSHLEKKRMSVLLNCFTNKPLFFHLESNPLNPKLVSTLKFAKCFRVFHKVINISIVLYINLVWFVLIT